jgi:hypothetical protein
MMFPDGTVYTGTWRQGKKHGHGIEIGENGSVRHCGWWKNDTPCISGKNFSVTSVDDWGVANQTVLLEDDEEDSTSNSRALDRSMDDIELRLSSS